MHKKYASYVIVFMSLASLSLLADEKNTASRFTMPASEKVQQIRDKMLTGVSSAVDKLKEVRSIDAAVDRMTVLDPRFRTETVKPCLRAAKVVVPVLLAYQACKSAYARIRA